MAELVGDLLSRGLGVEAAELAGMLLLRGDAPVAGGRVVVAARDVDGDDGPGRLARHLGHLALYGLSLVGARRRQAERQQRQCKKRREATHVATPQTMKTR